MKKAFLTGITGMDSSHMADFLLSKKYKVYGLIRRSSCRNLWRIQHIINDIELIEGDLLDRSSLDGALRLIQPDEIYNFAAQSHVKTSFDSPIYTADVTGLGVLRLLESVRMNCPNARVFQASSSEMFGKVRESPQKETTPFYPRSPYGVAKVFAHQICVNYRESYNMHISCGISFNHESPRRGEEFVTRKITKGVAEIRKGLRNYVTLGNLETSRDWGWAPDFVKAYWLMLQQDRPDDYVVATGKTHTIRDLIKEAFSCAGLYNPVDPQEYIKRDQRYMRPADVQTLCGDYSKIKEKLGWEPVVPFSQMIRAMVEADMGENDNLPPDVREYITSIP